MYDWGSGLGTWIVDCGGFGVIPDVGMTAAADWCDQTYSGTGSFNVNKIRLSSINRDSGGRGDPLASP